MYRKRMSDALQEARAYSLISEVMVFKGGRGMSVSKKDLPVFRAKGWKLKEELEEANMKRLLQALQDKLSKEGGAAGFDDLKKTAKTMGVDLTPDMLKNMPGIMQHRDGDYILEETITEFKKMVVTIADPMKRAKAMDDIKRFGKGTGFRIDKMRDGKSFRIDGKGADLNKFATDMKNFYGAEIKAESLEEALSIPNARKEIQKIYDKAKRDGFLGTTGHDDFKELLKQTDRKKLYRDMHKVGSFFASASGAKPKAVGKELVDLSYKVNEETELEEGIKPYVSMQRDSKTNKMNYVVLDKDEKEVYRSSDERLATAYLRKNFNKLREELEEAFSKKDFQKLEQSNDHTEAAKKLIDMFGTSDEKKEMNDIKARHEKTGYISGTDYSKRIKLVNRYYSRLK